MSRKSHAFADGTPKFSWRIKQIDTPRGRYVCECVTHPDIVGFGDSEQLAMLAAKRAMEKAVDTDALHQAAPGSEKAAAPSPSSGGGGQE